MLVNLRAALAETPPGCIGFNLTSLEALDALMAVADLRSRHTIIQLTDRYLDHFGESLVGSWMVPRLAASPRGFVVHLDHAVSLAAVRRALDLGFTSVMYDGSRLPLADNIAQTQKAKEMARRAGASIEAEVGHVGGREDGAAREEESWLTNPEDAQAFVAEVEVDALAISVGTAHGVYRPNHSAHLRLDRIRDLAAAVRVPLVLHGASGLPLSTLQRAVRAGIRKVNIGTELKHAWVAGIEAAARETREPWEIRERTVAHLMAAIQRLQRVVTPEEDHRA